MVGYDKPKKERIFNMLLDVCMRLFQGLIVFCILGVPAFATFMSLVGSYEGNMMQFTHRNKGTIVTFVLLSVLMIVCLFKVTFM